MNSRESKAEIAKLQVAMHEMQHLLVITCMQRDRLAELVERVRCLDDERDYTFIEVHALKERAKKVQADVERLREWSKDCKV